jgi:hypothetical protein
MKKAKIRSQGLRSLEEKEKPVRVAMQAALLRFGHSVGVVMKSGHPNFERNILPYA